MEPNIPTSFIPKRPVLTDAALPKNRSHSVGLLSFLTIIIVLGTIISFTGVYLYEKTLIAQRDKLARQINTAREGIGSEFVYDMKRLNMRIDGVKSIIKSHIVVTPIFQALQQTTLRSVQYKTFTYSFNYDPLLKQTLVQVSMLGTARSYATIALQSDAFAQNTLIKNPVFSNLTIDDKTGTVNFRLVFNVDPADLSYENFIKNYAQPAAAVPELPGGTQ